jgi:peptidoglycan DL-endopeptidase CwlO
VTSHRARRSLTGALIATVAVATASLIPAPAGADPALPNTASEATRQLAQLNHEAERLTEEYKHAQDQLVARRGDLDKARADFDAARRQAEEALAKQAEYRSHVDKLAAASFQGARFNQLSALLVSDSPQDFLDQMSALDILATDNKQQIDSLNALIGQAAKMQRAAEEAQGRAIAAEQQAAQVEAEIKRRKDEMDRHIKLVQDRYNQLTGRERGELRGVGRTNYPQVPGSSIAVKALNSALTRQGSPYQWAAEGPSRFDCSGLVYWSYLQHGRTLPRSSRSQATVGSPVSTSAMQPGDLVFFYSPISHVGIYVGDGQLVHAPQSGDVVKVAPLGSMPLTAVRRIGD